MANIMSDLFREIERRVDTRRAARIEPVAPFRFPGEKPSPRLPNWPKPTPYVPTPNYRLRESHL